MAREEMTIKLNASELVKALEKVAEAWRPITIAGHLSQARSAWGAGDLDAAQDHLAKAVERMTPDERLRETDWFQWAADRLHP